MSKYKNVIQKFKEMTAKECYSISVIEDIEPDIFDDKLGGKPYFPIGVEWPLDSRGVPMNLLLQVNLKNIKLDNFPEHGILEIFTNVELDWPVETKVFLFEDDLDYRKDIPDVDFEKFVIPRAYKINLEKQISHMPISNDEADGILCKLLKDINNENVKHSWDVEDDEFFDELYNGIPDACIGGYPDFTQDDPRGGDINRNYCLFKLDSNLHKDIYIGDCGILTVTMSDDDLKNSNFENAIIDWDCC